MNDNNLGPALPAMPTEPPQTQKVPPPSSKSGTAPDPEASPQAKRSRWRKDREAAVPAAAVEESDGSKGDNIKKRGSIGHPRRRWVWGTVTLIAFLAAAVFWGSTLPDPKKSSEYLALQSEKSTLSKELETAKSEYQTLEGGMKAREGRAASREAAAATKEASIKTAEEAVKKREEAVNVAEKQKAANTVREGTWTVGVDIEPGTYRTEAEVASSCYWGIYRTGSNGADIVDNDIVSGGRPMVNLSAGQDFKTSRCGTWLKQ